MKRTPIQRKPAKPKKRPAMPCCWSNRCKTRPAVFVTEDSRYCKTHAAKIADAVVGTWVKYVRDLRCQSCGAEDDLEWAHIRSRGAHPSLHWYVGPSTDEPGNSLALCRGCHFNFTTKPAKWDLFVEDRYPGLWTELVHMEIANARAGVKVDLAQVIREFRERVAA
jgi:hypothetical protein